MSIKVTPPFDFYTDLDGIALELGKIYVGDAGLDAQTNPKSIFWNEGLTVAAAQPIRTIAGVPDQSGTPSNIFVDGDYSITVLDKNDVLVYSKLNSDGDLTSGVSSFETRPLFVSAVAGGLTRNNGSVVIADGFIYRANSSETGITDLSGWEPAGRASIVHFGAIGDYNGSTGTDNTTSIDAALQWWGSAGARALHIPDGWFLYDGSVSVDLGFRYYNTLTCDGQVTFDHTSGIGWEIHNHRSLSFDLNMRNGGTLGDFSVLVPASGSTALQFHTSQQLDLNIRAMNYQGRVCRLTAPVSGDSNSRNIRASVNIWFGNRALSGDDAVCGQPICWDSDSVTNIGGAGEIWLNGSAMQYGPLFSDLADLSTHSFVAGPFLLKGAQYLGVRQHYMGDYWCGESDSLSALPILFAGKSIARNTKCAAWVVDSFRTLNSGGTGAYFLEFDGTTPGGLRIDKVSCTTADTGITLQDMPNVTLNSIALNAVTTGVKILGTANGRISLGFEDNISVAEEVLRVSSATLSEELIVSGRMDTGSATFPLIFLGSINNDVIFKDLHLDSSVASELINIGFAGDTKIRWLGGSATIGGSTTVFNSPKVPEKVVNVRGLTSKAIGNATILSGQTSVTFNHNLAFTPASVNLTGQHAEVSDVYASTVDATNITATVGSATSANRLIYWTADTETQPNDVDA